MRPPLVSGDVAEAVGELSSGEGEPVLRLSAPCGSTLSGPGAAPGSAFSSLNAGLMVISGLVWLGTRAWSPPTAPPPGDLGPDLTVRLRPARDSFSSRNFSCHSRA